MESSRLKGKRGLSDDRDAVSLVLVFQTKPCMLFSRHKINNFFLITFQRVWLEKVNEKTQYDRLIPILMVM